MEDKRAYFILGRGGKKRVEPWSRERANLHNMPRTNPASLTNIQDLIHPRFEEFVPLEDAPVIYAQIKIACN